MQKWMSSHNDGCPDSKPCSYQLGQRHWIFSHNDVCPDSKLLNSNKANNSGCPHTKWIFHTKCMSSRQALLRSTQANNNGCPHTMMGVLTASLAPKGPIQPHSNHEQIHTFCCRARASNLTARSLGSLMVAVRLNPAKPFAFVCSFWAALSQCAPAVMEALIE